MADWLSYEWDLGGKTAQFRVDLQYWELLPVLSYTHLIFVSCAPKKASSKAFRHTETRHVNALRDQLTEHLTAKAIYVGSITLPALIQYYFYTADESVMQTVSDVVRDVSELAVSYGCASEPRFVTYYRLLFPDDAKLQSVENAEFIKEVVKSGGDTTLVRRVTLRMEFLTQELRDKFIEDIPRAGFTVEECVDTESPTHPFGVDIRGYSTLIPAELNRYTARAIRVAARYEGMLENIYAAFIPRHSPL